MTLFKTGRCWGYSISFNSLWFNDAIWRQRSWSILAQVMDCCLTSPLPEAILSYLWVLWYPTKGNFPGNTHKQLTCVYLPFRVDLCWYSQISRFLRQTLNQVPFHWIGCIGYSPGYDIQITGICGQFAADWCLCPHTFFALMVVMEFSGFKRKADHQLQTIWHFPCDMNGCRHAMNKHQLEMNFNCLVIINVNVLKQKGDMIW